MTKLRSIVTACVTLAVVGLLPAAASAATRNINGGNTAAASTSGATIYEIYFDSPGKDTGSNTSRNGEWVAVINSTSSTKTLTGWTLRDASSHIYKFPSFALAAHKSVKVHTGSGTNSSTNLFWGSGAYIWNNTGDTAYLKNASGGLVDKCAYKASADPETHC